jgi:hypothetical protein
MKLKLSVLVCLLAANNFLFAQLTEPCSTMQLLHTTLQQDPSALARWQQTQNEIQHFIQTNAGRSTDNVVVTIPVVFHVIHTGQAVGSGLNVSDTALKSQISVLNECYRLRNSDTILIPSWFKGRQADIQVEFCLAKFDPQGNNSTGITRHNLTYTNFDTDIKPNTQWDPTQYLNIWTTNLGNTLLGYATFPNMGPANQDGVVLDYRHVGKYPANPFVSNSNLGKTGVHEVGHWLGLYHTFQDSCAGMTPQTCYTEGDWCCDTPPEAEATYGSPNLIQNSCHETPNDEYDMWMNYMDYADDASLYLFTHDQRDRMRAVLSTSRLSIQSSMGCTNSLNTFNFSGQVIDANTNAGVPNAKVLFDGQLDFEVTADANGNFTVTNLVEDYYDVYAGKWGYLTKQFATHSIFSSASSALTIPIQNHHYYDDFILNYNWTTSSTSSSGFWTRDIPQGTYYQGSAANPSQDVAYDFGLKCFITGNGGGSALTDNVDNGTSTLISPAFDLSGYTDPYIRYSRWFYDGAQNGNNPDDNMLLKLNNGTTTATLENIDGANTSVVTNIWVQKTFRINDFISPSSTMRLLIDVSDLSAGHVNIVEGGLDKFEVLEGNALSVQNVQDDLSNVLLFPNPTKGVVNVKYNSSASGKISIRVFNLLGEEIETDKREIPSENLVSLNVSGLNAGFYFVRLQTEHSEKTLKFLLLH